MAGHAWFGLFLIWLSLVTVHSEGEYDVIILGGGISGVSAASTLVSEGVTNFVLLEGRDEIGGRMLTKEIGGYVVEVGAQWVHLVKENTQNPLYLAVMKYNLSGVYSDFDDILFYDEEGNNVTEEGWRECGVLDEAFEQMYEYGEKLLLDNYRGDISLRGSLRWFGFNPKTPVQMACDYYYTEYESAEQASLLSNRYFVADESDNFGDEDYMIVDPRGYSILPQSILANEVPDWEDKVRMETVVTAINYTDDHVVVTTDQGSFTGKKVIVTFSLGVLQNSLVQFYPSLPEWKLEALHGFTMTDYIHIYVKFHANILWFVPYDTEWIIYASKRKGYFTVWQNMNKAMPGSHILQAAVSGNEARRLQASTDAEVLAEIVAVLRNMFGADVPEAEEVLVPRLNTDPFFQGSYADWPVGYTRSQHQALQAPVGPVYFSGDAYSVFYYGYAIGAMISSQEVARKVAGCLVDSARCAKPYVPPYAAKGCTYRVAFNYNPAAQIDDGSCRIVTKAPTSGTGAHIQTYAATVLVIALAGLA